ncbi:MAG: hypothetical protein QOF46_1525, partial [Paraburkholderia sp.]|nr:hypothetical protein [Paraburkholderia sp.]
MSAVYEPGEGARLRHRQFQGNRRQ